MEKQLQQTFRNFILKFIRINYFFIHAIEKENCWFPSKIEIMLSDINVSRNSKIYVEYIINFALAVSYMVALLASRKSGLG